MRGRPEELQEKAETLCQSKDGRAVINVKAIPGENEWLKFESNGTSGIVRIPCSLKQKIFSGS